MVQTRAVAETWRWQWRSARPRESLIVTLALMLVAAGCSWAVPGWCVGPSIGGCATGPTSPAPRPERPTPADRLLAPGDRSGPAVVGVATPGLPANLSGVDGFEALTGADVGIVSWYTAFGQRFGAERAAQVSDRGEIPMISWEPWDPGRGVDQPRYSLARIIAGDHDGYLRGWAAQLAAFDRPVLLRFAHEMNGDWYPWAEGVNGNRPGQYVAAWRHVHEIFQAEGADRVRWTWSPNTVHGSHQALSGLYPGDELVDWVAIDGYNGGTALNMGGWLSPETLFVDSIANVRALTGRPIMIGETASTEHGGDKAQWISRLFALLSDHPEIRAFVWFDIDKETDWRVGSSAASLAAFRHEIR